jgi:hypothetical protein
VITAQGTISKRVFPVRINTKGIPFGPPFDTDGTPMWKPFQDRDPTEDEMRAWDRLTVPHNLALVLGRASGFVVIDVDPRHGGNETIKKYPMPLTFTVRTPSGGHHYYFACPPGGCASQLAFDQGVEIKGDGNIVLIPPSSKNGVKYEIVDGTENLPVAMLPAWARTVKLRAVGESKWWGAFRTVPQGEQHARLVSLCGYIARTFPNELWPAIPEILWAIARRYPQDSRDPWTEADMAVIAETICAAEQRNRETRVKVRVLE